MGGTGVASANYGSGVLINPALLAKAKPEDDITVILPSVQAQITDKDNLRDEIDNISDKIDNYRDVVDNLTAAQIIANPLGTVGQFQSAAKDLADELTFLGRENRAGESCRRHCCQYSKRCALRGFCHQSLRACDCQHCG